MLYSEEFRHGWYVEGFAIPTIGNICIPLEHAWVQLADGAVIDPSYVSLGHTDISYFPALKLPWSRAVKLIHAGSPLPYMLSHKTSSNRASYLKARADSYKAAFGDGCVFPDR